MIDVGPARAPAAPPADSNENRGPAASWAAVLVLIAFGGTFLA
jgi:hypothetical protein